MAEVLTCLLDAAAAGDITPWRKGRVVPSAVEQRIASVSLQKRFQLETESLGDRVRLPMCF